MSREDTILSGEFTRDLHDKLTIDYSMDANLYGYGSWILTGIIRFNVMRRTSEGNLMVSIRTMGDTANVIVTRLCRSHNDVEDLVKQYMEST